jgi:transposase
MRPRKGDIQQVRSITDGAKKLKDLMAEEGRKMDGHANLCSIKGIGDKAATILLTEIGNINDFPDENKLCAYFGMAPRVSKSNETVHYGRITKKGSKIGRTTMVQCALIAKRYSPHLSRFHERIRKRRGNPKAIIATARKLLTIVYRTLKEKMLFTDFPNFVYTTT